MLNSRVRPLALLILSAFAAIPAGAGPNDALHVYGGVAYGHDDNLLRIADDQPAFDNQRGDSWWTREGGLIFDKTYSRQRITLVAKLSKTNFDHFKQLDYDGKDLQANWGWQLGNHLEGRIGTSYSRCWRRTPISAATSATCASHPQPVCGRRLALPFGVARAHRLPARQVHLRSLQATATTTAPRTPPNSSSTTWRAAAARSAWWRAM
jgi:hypothetical protein